MSLDFVEESRSTSQWQETIHHYLYSYSWDWQMTLQCRFWFLHFWLSPIYWVSLGTWPSLYSILIDSHLKTVMYFFPQALLLFRNSIHHGAFPRFLYSLSTGDKTISYNACVSQLFFYLPFWKNRIFLLAIMSYDRYVAICKPLHYATIMNSRVCVWLVICCWIAGWLSYFHHSAWA